MPLRKAPRLVKVRTADEHHERVGRIIEQLYQALVGVAERQLPEDPLPCFCVRHERDGLPDDTWRAGELHDEWCENARFALKQAEDFRTKALPA